LINLVYTLYNTG